MGRERSQPLDGVAGVGSDEGPLGGEAGFVGAGEQIGGVGSHRHEPGCAIKEAVEDPARLLLEV